MDADSLFVIVNPRAGHGRAARQWPRLRRALHRAVGPAREAWTEAPGHATRLARTALQAGRTDILAVGGDGTLHEVVNGFFDDGHPVAPSAALAHVPCGTGSDFRRALGLPASPAATLRRLVAPQPRRIDLGRVVYRSLTGEPRTRLFLNVASFGLSGRVVQYAGQLARYGLAGSVAYLGAILRALWSEHPVPVHTTAAPPAPNRAAGSDAGAADADRTVPEAAHDGPVWAAAVANGRHFGGGLCIAPEARLDDGALDVTVIGGLSAAQLVRHAPRFYRGTHGALDGVCQMRGATVVARPRGPEPVLLEADGELLGRLPATFSVLPNALRMLH
jgi:diacylglycerol kinase family enzyme